MADIYLMLGIVGAFLFFFLYMTYPRQMRNALRGAYYIGRELPEVDVGYPVDQPYPMLPVMLRPIVETPDYKGVYTNFFQNKAGTWSLEIDGSVVINDVDEDVNIDWGNLWMLTSGWGHVLCNKDRAGRTHEGWMGIGSSKKNSMAWRIKSQEHEINDLRNMLEKYKLRHDSDERKEAERLGTLARQKRDGEKGEETEEVE